MNLYNVLLNNKISFELLENSESENVIYCKSFSDYLFNVGMFTTKTKEVILEYVVDNAEKYVVADVTFDNGECYRGIRFKVVVNEHIETPYSTINLNLLNNKTQVAIPQQSQQIIEDVEEVVVEPAPIHVSTPIIEAPDYTETINEALKLQKKLNVEKEEIRKQKILLEKQDTIKHKLSEYKQELLEDYFNATRRQTELLEGSIQENITVAEHELSERITNTFADYNIQLEGHKNETRKEQLAFILEKINTSIAQTQQDLSSIIDSKFILQQEQFQEALYEKSQSLQQKYEQKLIVELEQYKEALFEEFYSVSDSRITQLLSDKKQLTEQEIVDTFAKREQLFTTAFNERLKTTSEELSRTVQEFTDKLPDITNNIIILENKVKKILDEKVKQEQSDKFNASQQKYITDTAQYWAKRILDLGGGGGSVAVQYAKGGTMNGSLAVNNLFPNNNTGEIGSPTNRWNKIHVNQIDALSANVVVELSGFFVDGDFTVNGTISASGGNSNQWNSAYSTMQANSATWSNTYTLTATNFIVTRPSNWAVNTLSNGVTATLPSSPSTGTTIGFLDASKTWAVNNFVLLRNGQTIESLAENLNCDISGFSFSLTYVGGGIGWRVY